MFFSLLVAFVVIPWFCRACYREGAVMKGVPITEAVIRAGAIRTKPILLTAAALMVGAFVIILDPTFQGLAVSLLFGVGASTLLTLVVIPVLYYLLMGGRQSSAVPPTILPAGPPDQEPDREQPTEPLETPVTR